MVKLLRPIASLTFVDLFVMGKSHYVMKMKLTSYTGQNSGFVVNFETKIKICCITDFRGNRLIKKLKTL